MDSYGLDDATAAALEALAGESLEHIGLIYQDGDGIRSTLPKSSAQNAKVKAHIIIPKGSLRALFHNHPVARRASRDLKAAGGGENFSDEDKAQARKLGVPSYILTPTGRVLKFDPVANVIHEVLAQFPVRTAGAHSILASK